MTCKCGKKATVGDKCIWCLLSEREAKGKAR